MVLVAQKHRRVGMEEALEIVPKKVDLQVSCEVGWVLLGFSHPGAREGWVSYLGTCVFRAQET